MQEKTAYKDAFAGLRELKQEIEHLQMLLEQSRTKLHRDFEHWLALMLRQQLPASAVTAGALTSATNTVSSAAAPVHPVPRYYVQPNYSHFLHVKLFMLCPYSPCKVTTITCIQM